MSSDSEDKSASANDETKSIDQSSEPKVCSVTDPQLTVSMGAEFPDNALEHLEPSKNNSSNIPLQCRYQVHGCMDAD